MNSDIQGDPPERDLMLHFADLALRNAKEPSMAEVSRRIGKRLSQIRRQRQLSRARLAVLSGVGDFSIEMIERGLVPDSGLPFQQVEALANALAIPVDDLLHGTVQETSSDLSEWKAIVSQWGVGMVRAVRDSWQWVPRIAPNLVPVSRAGAEVRTRPSVELIDPPWNELRIKAGRTFAQGKAVLLRLSEDKTDLEAVGEVVLDADGYGELSLPDARASLRLVILPANR